MSYDYHEPTTPDDSDAETPFDTEPPHIPVTNRLLGADVLGEDVPTETTDDSIATQIRYRSSNGDPIFGFLLALALSIGLTPMLPFNADLRYTVAWGALAGVGVLSWLLGSADRIGQEEPENLVWGVVFGLLVGAPFLLFGAGVLARTSRLIFPEMEAGTVLAFVIFVIPLAETLFFRSVMQRNLEFYISGALSGVWSIILFFPVMWEEVLTGPAVAVVIGIIFLTINMLFAYVRERNGLAAAWVCQIVTLLLLIFVPFL